MSSSLLSQANLLQVALPKGWCGHRQYIDENATCHGCQTKADRCVFDTTRCSTLGDCLKFTCYEPDCKVNHWFFCVLCEKRLSRSAVQYHFGQSTKHSEKEREPFSPSSCPGGIKLTPWKRDHTGELKFFFPENHDEILEMHDEREYQQQRQRYVNSLECEQLQNKNNNLKPKQLAVPFNPPPETTPEEARNIVRLLPKLPQRPHRLDQLWLQDAMRDVPRPNPATVAKSFLDCDNMTFFFVAEHSATPGSTGGGIQYLCARSMQKTCYINPRAMPHLESSLWHVKAMIQHQSMTEKQRKRQSSLTLPLAASVAARGDTFLGPTAPVLHYDDYAKHYGNAGRHSMWTCLPTAPVQNFHGVAYVRPQDALRQLFASGRNLDAFILDANNHEQARGPYGHQGKVYHITESRRAWEI